MVDKSMEVDPPVSTNVGTRPIHSHGIAPYGSRDLESVANGNTEDGGLGTLKRSNSAPMINVLVANETSQSR